MALPSPCLCLDGSVRGRFQVGLAVGGVWVATASSSADPAESIQPCVEQVLASAGKRLGDIAAFAVNLGPGSILGIRASILSARAWSEVTGKPVFGWSGHRAAAQLATGTCEVVVSEGRAGVLNVQRVDAQGPVGDLFESDAASLAGLRLRPIRGGFRHASELTLGEEIDAWEHLPALFTVHNLLQEGARLDALNSPATYVTWSGQRHQGGTV